MAGRLSGALNKFLRQCFFAVLRHWGAALTVIAVMLALSLWALQNTRFENNITRMLPDNSEALEIYSKIRHCSMFNKAMLLLECDTPEIFSTPEFERKYDALARGIAGHKEFIKQVDHRLFKGGDLMAPCRILPYAMQLCTPAILPDAEKLPKQVMKELANLFSTGRSQALQQDPPGISRVLFAGLNRFREISALQTAWGLPWVASMDGKYLLLTAETTLELSDTQAAAVLEKIMEEEFAQVAMPPSVKKKIVLPHKRAEINEKVIRKDVQLAGILTLALFGLLTWIFYRGDLRSFLIALITFPAGVLSVGLLVMFFDTPQLFVLGLGGVVTGIAVDYGIHIYGAMNGRLPYRSLAGLLPSLFIGMLTSASAFLVFTLSSMSGVRQLGLFAGAALIFSLGLMLVVLPKIFKNKPQVPELALANIKLHRQHSKITVAVFAMLALTAAAGFMKLEIHGDVRQYDMSQGVCDKAEQQVSEIFQKSRSGGIALIEGKTPEDVLTKADKIADKDVFTLAEVIPPESVQQKNLAAWKKFDLADYGRKLRAAGGKAGFPADYFDDFLNNLEQTQRRNGLVPAPALLENIQKRLLVKGSNDLWYTLVMYKESDKTVEYLKKFDFCTVISRERIPKVMAEDIMRAILPTGILAVFTVLLLCRIYFKSTKKTFFAMLPVAYSLLFTLGVYGWLGKGINIPVMAAAVILCGLGVDYGIFVLHAIDSKRMSSIFHSITVSAVTTFAGGMTVAFAQHPMLHDAGITLIIGITAVWATAIFLLPCLYRKRDWLQ